MVGQTLGIISEDTYPYVGKQQTCKYNQSDVKAYLEDYIPIEPGDEDTLLLVVGFLGPTSVALDGTRLPFYTSGTKFQLFNFLCTHFKHFKEYSRITHVHKQQPIMLC